MTSQQPTEDLDPEELIHLAVAASDRNDSAQAISLLKRAVSAKPDFARAHYLLGAERAQIGLYERAAEDMGTALIHDPSLHAARFQLGLLQLSSQNPLAANGTWKGLDDLGPQHYLVLFRDGLLKLAQDDFDGCEALLRAGIAGNRENLPLNVDMERLLRKLDERKDAAAPPAAPEDDAEQHLLLGAYSANRSS